MITGVILGIAAKLVDRTDVKYMDIRCHPFISKMQFLSILPIALFLSATMIYFDVLGRIFGGMNGVL